MPRTNIGLVRLIQLYFAAAVLAAVLFQVSCAGSLPPPPSLPGPGKPAERVGEWGLTFAMYNPALFGPERPLSQLIKEYHLPLKNGKLRKPLLFVNKAQRRLELWVRRRMVKAYRIQLGWSPHGPKRREGDRKTPEGRYFVCRHSSSPYYRALWLSYPNAEDARVGLGSKLIGAEEYSAILDRLAERACPPQDTKLGGAILIHGQLPELTDEMAAAQRANPKILRPGFQIGDADPVAVPEYQDWTDGCVAMFNPDIRELYEWIPDGAQITIVANAAVTAPANGPKMARAKGKLSEAVDRPRS